MKRTLQSNLSINSILLSGLIRVKLLPLFLVLFVTIFCSQRAAAQLNIQLNSEDPYPEIFPGLAGRSALTPVADVMGRDYLYVTANEWGLKIYETSAGLNLIQTVDTTVLGNKAATVYQRDSLLYVGLGGLFGDTIEPSQLAIVNVADPYNPQLLDIWTDPASSSMQASGVGVVRVQGDYAYLGAMAEGLIILNISNPNSISFVSKLTPAIDFPHINNGPTFVNARGLSLADTLAYMCYDAGGMRVINCADVNNPVQIGEFANPITYIPMNMPRAYNNVVVHDTLAYVAVDYCGLEIWSVNDPQNAQLVAHWNPVNCPVGQWEQAPVHTNELILQPECELLFVSTGKSDMMVLDVADPNLPVAVDSFGTVLDTAGVWGIDVTDEHIYLAYIYVADLPLPWPFVEPFHSYWGGMKELTYDKCSASSGEIAADGVRVYPNPASNELIISGLDDAYDYRLFNVSGGTLLTRRAKGEERLNVSEFSSGVYFLYIEDNNKTWIEKIYIE